ncbi:uncharacterized protein [Rutidosis leptorrhynchoides]|uniref:uncharacterized protein n=1 Tax=Rutidosis leptorrhynchoides TaxID=125765 RepID=UPI003A99DBB7
MKMPMASSKSQSSSVVQRLVLLTSVIFNLFVVDSSPLDLPVQNQLRGGGYRGLKSFMETASGNNITFDCSPSGPCIYCSYSEKKDETYRCSETGYRIPMKCAKVVTPVDEDNENKRHKGRANLENTNDKLELHESNAEDSTMSIRQRNMLEDSSDVEVGKVAYVTYRSCMPAVSEEKLSVLGFEALMLLLLVSSSFVIFRRKGTLIMPFMPGAVRVPSNPRF